MADEYLIKTDHVPEWRPTFAKVTLPQIVVVASAFAATGTDEKLWPPKVARSTQEPPLSDSEFTKAVPTIAERTAFHEAPGENTVTGVSTGTDGLTEAEGVGWGSAALDVAEGLAVDEGVAVAEGVAVGLSVCAPGFDCTHPESKALRAAATKSTPPTFLSMPERIAVSRFIPN